jgi:hypothetical protein
MVWVTLVLALALVLLGCRGNGLVLFLSIVLFCLFQDDAERYRMVAFLGFGLDFGLVTLTGRGFNYIYVLSYKRLFSFSWFFYVLLFIIFLIFDSIEKYMAEWG